MRTFVPIFALLFLAGCTSPAVVTQAGPPSITAPIVAAAASTDSALIAAQAAEQLRMSKVLANVTGAKIANEGNPAGTAKTVVKTELEIAEGRLADVQANPTEVAEAARRKMLFEAGKAEEARNSAATATKDAASILIELGALNAELEASRKAEALAVANVAAEAEKNRIANAKLIDEVNAEAARKIEAARNAVRMGHVALFNKIGASLLGVSILAIGVTLFFGGATGLKAVAPLVGLVAFCGLCCLGLAQLIGQWWFMWAILSLIVVIIAVVGTFVWHAYQTKSLKVEAEKKAAQLKAALDVTVPVLDDAYDEGTAEVRKVLDDEIFSRMSSKMDQAVKQTIHQLRAAAITTETQSTT